MDIELERSGFNARRNSILRRHWLSTARACGISEELAHAMIDDLIALTPAVISIVTSALPPTFPAELADSVFAGLRRAAAKLADSR